MRRLAFKLGGTVPFPTPKIVVPPVPEPPKLAADAATIKKGAELYRKFVCDGCHSPGLDGSGAWVEDGAVPDLRYAPPEVHKNRYATNGAWRAYRGEQAQGHAKKENY